MCNSYEPVGWGEPGRPGGRGAVRLWRNCCQRSNLRNPPHGFFSERITMENLQQTFGVLVVFGLLGATLWWLRRRGLAHFTGIARRRQGGILQSVECLPLSADRKSTRLNCSHLGTS